MSLLNSVLGSLSPPRTFRSSFEDPHAREHELHVYSSPPTSSRIPPPIASTVLWRAPSRSASPAPRVPDDLLALQRRARHLEQQLQELLDAQADGLLNGLAGSDARPDDTFSNGSTTPTVSSVRTQDGDAETGGAKLESKRRKVGLNTARRGIFRRIQQLSEVRSDELDILDGDLQDMQSIVEKTRTWGKKKARLERRIKDIESESSGARTKSLQEQASSLEQDIRMKEEELWALKSRHRSVLNELADSENMVEAKLSSYKASLSILDNEVATFLARPPGTSQRSRSSSPYLSLPPKRRTLEMANDYWQDEYMRLTDKCQEVDTDRAALDEGAVMWNQVVKKVSQFESSLQRQMQQDPARILEMLIATTVYLEEKLDHATAQSWNLLVCAIGAELEAFRQGREVLEQALGLTAKGQNGKEDRLVDTTDPHETSEEEGSASAIRIQRSPPKSRSPPKPAFVDTDNDDPDPELLISHQDIDTE